MLVFQVSEVCWFQQVQDRPQIAVQMFTPSPVDFKNLKQQQQLFEMDFREPAVYGKEGMGQRMANFRLIQIRDQFKDILATLLNVQVLGLGDVISQNMHFAAILGKTGGDFLADEGIRKVGDLQAALQGVVVRDGDQAHPLIPQRVVNVPWFGVAFRTADLPQYPLRWMPGVLGVHMQICFSHQFHKLTSLDLLYFCNRFTEV